MTSSFAAPTPPHDDPLRRVVVGVDGSKSSLAAVAWAARVVGPHGQIHAVSAGRPVDTSWADVVHAAGAELVSHDTEPADGKAADVLTRIAVEQRADAIVVGSHDAPHRALRLIGRTITALVRQSPVPLVIVPDTVSAAHSDVDLDTVVIGVGDSEATDAAMRWAADYADARPVRIAVVKAVSNRPTFTSEGLLTFIARYLDPGVLREWAREDVAEFAEQLQAMTDIDVDITTAVVDGSAGARLVDAGKSARLLIIGRGQPAAVHHAISHAPCPVVVVPPV